MASGVLKGAASGASAGAMLGPWGAAIGGVIGAGLGALDLAKGKKKQKEAQSFYEKNKYEIPEAARSALGVAERQAQGTRMPGEDIARTRLAATTAQGVGAAQQAATSSSDVLGVLSGLYGQQMEGEQDIAMAGAERFDRNQSMLREELGRMSDLERERWQYNSLYPYQQMLGQAEAYQTRGAQGISAGLGALGSAAGGFAQLSSAQNMNQQFMQQMGLGEQWTPSTMAGARAQGLAGRKALPSYSMQDNVGFADPAYRTQLKPQTYR